MHNSLTDQLTRSLASDDFAGVLAQLPAFEADVERRFRDARDEATRDSIAAEALAFNRRWLSLAKSLQANMREQLRSLAVQTGYADDAEPGHVLETIG